MSDKKHIIIRAVVVVVCLAAFIIAADRLRVTDKEDGIPVFLYKAIISSESISKDKLSLNIR